MALIRRFPAFVVLLLISAAMMLVPALYALHAGEAGGAARAFGFSAMLLALLAVILGLATMNRRPRRPGRYHLATLLLAYVLLPLALAAPLAPLAPGLGLKGAYFEMISCLTTTGATLFDRPELAPDSIHLWRALVGWAGGYMILVTAFAVLAPLGLGGFEIGREDAGPGGGRRATIEEASHRILVLARIIGPYYAGATALLGVLLYLGGAEPFVALCHAMAALSTSGISPNGGQIGRVGEIAMLPFLLLAISHRPMIFLLRRKRRIGLSDPEMQLMLITVAGVTLVLVVLGPVHPMQAARAAWGSVFTLVSYMTTTGFESRDWHATWAERPAPGVILLGVAVMGGGIATTAGGVKLLRIVALYRQGLREMGLLVHPSSLPRHGQGDQAISASGPRIAFIFLMLFLIALALLMIALSATGIDFMHSLSLAIAALTTNGPAIHALEDGQNYSDLGETARLLLAGGMIVGRMETIVIISLFNPAYWRH